MMASGEFSNNIVFDTKVDLFGTRLATVDSKGLLQIYSIEHKKKTEPILSLQAHQGPCWRLDWSPPSEGTFIATCGLDRKCHIWSENGMGKWEKVFSFDDGEQSLTAVKFTPAGQSLKLAFSNAKGAIMILNYDGDAWDAARILKKECHTAAVNSLSWLSPTIPRERQLDGRSAPEVFALSGLEVPKLASASCDMTIRIHAVKQQIIEELHCISGLFTGSIRDIDCNPLAQRDSFLLAAASQDRQLLILRIKQSDQLTDSSPVFSMKFESEVWRVRWNRTGTMLAASYIEKDLFNKVRIIRAAENGKWVSTDSIYASTN